MISTIMVVKWSSKNYLARISCALIYRGCELWDQTSALNHSQGYIIRDQLILRLRPPRGDTQGQTNHGGVHMINRSEVSRALAKAIAYKQCGKDYEAEEWAIRLVKLLECANILKN